MNEFLPVWSFHLSEEKKIDSSFERICRTLVNSFPRTESLIEFPTREIYEQCCIHSITLAVATLQPPSYITIFIGSWWDSLTNSCSMSFDKEIRFSLLETKEQKRFRNAFRLPEIHHRPNEITLCWKSVFSVDCFCQMKFSSFPTNRYRDGNGRSYQLTNQNAFLSERSLSEMHQRENHTNLIHRLLINC